MNDWKSLLDSIVRPIGFVLAILVVSYMAVFQQAEAASGAIIGLLGLAGSYLYRGKVESR